MIEIFVLFGLICGSLSSQAPTREQPHVVLHNQALNTFKVPQYHEDEKFVSYGHEVQHEYIVQMKQPIVESRDIIASDCNVKFGSYFPHNSFLLYVTGDAAEKVREHENVLWMGAFRAEYKVADVLHREDVDSFLDHDLFRFAVHFNGEIDQTTFADTLNRRIVAQSPAGIDIISTEASEAKNVVLVTFGKHGNDHARRVADYLATMPDIHYVEPLGPTQYHLGVAKLDIMTGAKGATLPPTLNGGGVTVCIGDNGVDINAPCLSGKYVLPQSPPPADLHGTAMAAVAVGTGGIAPNGRVFFIGLPRGSPLTAPGTKLQAAATQRANIIVSAAGAAAAAYNAGAADVDEFLRLSEPSLMILAAGNAGNQLSGPAYAKNALVVGSVETGPNRHIVGAGSPRVGTADRRFKPDVVSAGDNINLGGCGMAPAGGTSLAAASAAGAAAIVAQYFTEGWFPQGELTDQSESLGFQPSGALIKATLIHAAVPVSGAKDAGGMIGAGRAPSVVQGFGRIQLDQVLFVKGSSPFNKLSVVDGEELEQGTPFRFCISVDAVKPIRITMAWMDLKGDVAAGHQLVNDVDLLIYDETGRQWRGNDADGFDHANNVEQITFTPPAPGKYVVVVYGRQLIEKQKIAMVMTGSYSELPCVGSVLNPTDGSYTSTFDFPKCPNGCSFFENDCQNGNCQCTAIGSGIDCSSIECPTEGCGLNGECDYALGTCRCIEKKRGDMCNLSFANVEPDEIFQTKSTSEFIGQDPALFGGLFVFIYIIGCVCAIVFGAFCGTKFLESRRDAAARA